MLPGLVRVLPEPSRAAAEPAKEKMSDRILRVAPVALGLEESAPEWTVQDAAMVQTFMLETAAGAKLRKLLLWHAIHRAIERPLLNDFEQGRDRGKNEGVAFLLALADPQVWKQDEQEPETDAKKG